MSVLENCQPKKVFAFFEELCAIPHGSHNTKAISDYCVAFAKSRGLAVEQDAHNNVIIRKAASVGFEHAPTVILQGHLDMVCVKDADCPKDMAQEGLDLMVEGDFVRAEGTSLGGDDGIAVAMALAILDDDTLPHPALEALFTVDEEVGMLGAMALDFSTLKGRWLINIDSEEEGIITVGCAGGTTLDCLLPLHREERRGVCCTVTLAGFKGGHSGTEIHKGRASATALLGRLLQEMASAAPYGLVTLQGGTVGNAIPCTAEATLVASAGDVAALQAACAQCAAALCHEYAVTDGDMNITFAAGEESTVSAVDAAGTNAAVFALAQLPQGVVTMSQDIAGLVQTSLNLGVLTMSENEMKMRFTIRSSVESQKLWLRHRLEGFMAFVGGKAEVVTDYPGWEFRRDSAFRELVVACYREQYGAEPEVAAIHAGLECGILCGKAPDLDCVSIGPDIHDIHSPQERLSISSTQRVYELVLKVLEKCK